MPSLQIHQDVDLQALNTMAVPASARYLASIESQSQAESAIEFANQNSVPWLVLGEGSNSLFTHDFQGLIILNRIKGIQLLEEDKDSVLLRVHSGENWHSLVKETVERGWNGLQNLALIPGLVGAAPIQNIGAYGVELSQHLVELSYLDTDSRSVKILSNRECEFGYRDSIFKHALKGKVIVLSIDLRLSKSTDVILSYPALCSALAHVENPSLQQVFDAVCEIRSSKLPWPADIPNSGSFFKNPIVNRVKLAELKTRYPDIVSFEFGQQFKLAAAWLIEQAGWKSRSENGISVHHRQALVIINPERREGQSILEFARLIQEDVANKFGLELEIEPQLIV